MDLNIKSEDILCQIKSQLNNGKIKLWLQPYYHEDKGIGDEEKQAIQNLAEEMSKQLNIVYEDCLSALTDLQSHALERLKSNQVFNETGIASVRVKITGEMPQVLNLSISLTVDCSELINELSKSIDMPITRIKFISGGRVLKPAESLSSQGVKNGSQIMAVILAPANILEEDEKKLKTLESTKKDLKLLAGRSNNNHEFYLQVENQSGESLNLPLHERKALVTAMGLHEKGRVALKHQDYSLALILFLEADKEFSVCNSQLLNTCDNFALLHLDIAWCYLCLRNASQIPDAERRLRLCEENFHKCYGPNLERLLAIKGTTGNEQVLFMRLHLLQGVVCFHKNQRLQARQLFERAQSELNGLKIDDNKLCLLIELGFTPAEARFGLRATHGNVEAAEEFMYRRRKERESTSEMNRLKQKKDRERSVLGLCSDGQQFCDPDLVNQLEGMGFGRAHSVAALKLSNNNINEAINIIQDQPHLLPSNTVISEEAIAQVVSLGVDPAAAREALEKSEGLVNAVKSMNSLSQGAGSSEAAEAAATASASAISFIAEYKKKIKKRTDKERKAFERISEDLKDNNQSEDYLDLNLAQEEQFLIEYTECLGTNITD